MNTGGEAAEQVVRMSLDGVEVMARISGEGAKQLAVLIAAIIREEQKTSGKAKLSNLIKSGQELKVFTVQQKDIKKFAQVAKTYGVVYSVLREKNNKDPNAEVDIVAKASDAGRISRALEKIKLNTVDKASVIQEMEADRNPQQAKSEKDRRSLQNSEKKPSIRKKLEKYREADKGPDFTPNRAPREHVPAKTGVKER